MIIVDTNVLSELMRPDPAPAVIRWFNAQRATELHVTSITQAEILLGIQVLPKGRRRDKLAAEADATFGSDFHGRILAFGSDAANAYALLKADRRRRGRPIAPLDAQIAAIARASGASVAARNIDDFQHCGVDLIDPWQP